jgi:WD40 repeat protein
MASFNGDSSRVATASLDGTARLWDSKTGKEIGRYIGHTKGVWGAVFSPDDQRVATSSDDGTLRLWDVSSGAELLKIYGEPGSKLNLAFDPFGEKVAITSSSQIISIYDVQLATSLRGEELRKSVCAYKLIGASVFTKEDGAEPLLSQSLGQSACR